MPSVRDYTGGDEVSVDVTSHCIQDIGMTPTSINGLLIERGIKMIPWNCAALEHRRILAVAFRGTRLEQWLEEWCPVRPVVLTQYKCTFLLNFVYIQEADYPRLVAIGRTKSGDVVCSEFRGSLERTLRWMELATKAHFHDYEDAAEVDVELDDLTTDSLNLEDEEEEELGEKPRKVTFATEQEVSNQAKLRQYLR